MKTLKDIRYLTKEEVEDYYNTQNHSQKECAEHYEVNVGVFIRLLKEFRFS